jgi:hypothetical protein
MVRGLPFDSRRAVRVLEPGVQLRLPAYLLGATLVFVGAFAWNGWSAFQRLVELTLVDSPDIFIGTVWEQTRSFLVVSGVILIAYLAVVAAVCLAHSHLLLGPRVALLRHVEALKNGDFGSRVMLRRRDRAFRELAQDLNDLAQMLERAEKDPHAPAADGALGSRLR